MSQGASANAAAGAAGTSEGPAAGSQELPERKFRFAGQWDRLRMLWELFMNADDRLISLFTYKVPRHKNVVARLLVRRAGGSR